MSDASYDYMGASILGDLKKLLGLDAAYTVFDQDLIIHTNSVLALWTQLGIGSPTGFVVHGVEQKWSEYLDSCEYPSRLLPTVRSCLYLKVRQLFDPPNNSYLVTAINEQVAQTEWMLNVAREEAKWKLTHPEPTSPTSV